MRRAMMCGNEQIQLLLPDYLEGTLHHQDRVIVEEHLAVCSDCAAELELIGLLASEAVPDPGEAFWAAMPGQIYREVRRHGRGQRFSWIFGLFRGGAAARWAWTTAMIAVITLLSWAALRPFSHQAPVPVAKRSTLSSVDIIGEASNNADIGQADLDRLSAWAHQELLSLQNGLPDALVNGKGTHLTGLGVELDEELASLSEEELDILIDTLNQDNEEA